MARASGLWRLSAETTSSPFPSSSRISTTAKAGEHECSWLRPSATDWAVVTVNPRPSIARESRWRKDLSSSTISNDRSVDVSPWNSAIAIYASTTGCPFCKALEYRGYLPKLPKHGGAAGINFLYYFIDNTRK